MTSFYRNTFQIREFTASPQDYNLRTLAAEDEIAHQLCRMIYGQALSFKRSRNDDGLASNAPQAHTTPLKTMNTAVCNLPMTTAVHTCSSLTRSTASYLEVTAASSARSLSTSCERISGSYDITRAEEQSVRRRMHTRKLTLFQTHQM
jgi:hypothetical protein